MALNPNPHGDRPQNSLELIAYEHEDSFVNESDPHLAERERLVELLLTPIPACNGKPLMELEYEMYCLWLTIYTKYGADKEFRYIYLDINEAICDQRPWEDAIREIRISYEYAQHRIGAARKEFGHTVLPFAYRVANPKDYPKHYPNPNAGLKAILAKSQADGVLALGMSEAAQSAIFRELCVRLWVAVLLNPNGDFVVETSGVVGYSKGTECHHLVFKLDQDARLFHCFPVREGDVAQYLTGAVNNPSDIIAKDFWEELPDEPQSNYLCIR